MAVSIEDSYPANRTFWPGFAALLGGALAMGIGLATIAAIAVAGAEQP